MQWTLGSAGAGQVTRAGRWVGLLRPGQDLPAGLFQRACPAGTGGGVLPATGSGMFRKAVRSRGHSVQLMAQAGPPGQQETALLDRPAGGARQPSSSAAAAQSSSSAPMAANGFPAPGREAAASQPLPASQAGADLVAGSTDAPSKLLPKLYLLGTAMLWGSYTVALRLVYTSPGPPDPAVVMAVRGVIQAAVLLLVAAATQPPARQSPQEQQHSEEPLLGEPGSGSGARQGAATSGEVVKQWVQQDSAPLWMAAVELGFYNYLASACQTFGLTLITATRASFLIQAKSLLTPLLASLAGFVPTRRVLAGCALALAGTLLIAADKAGGSSTVSSELAGAQLGGDAAIVLAAFFFSLATVRINGFTKSLPSMDIAAGKSLVLGVLAVAYLLYTASVTALEGRPLTSLWEGWASPVVWGALVWSAVGPGAIASYFHVKGLEDVPPAEAQVFFSSVPLWSAAFAWVMLGGEDLGAVAWVGGGAIMAAGILAATGSAPQQKKEE